MSTKQKTKKGDPIMAVLAAISGGARTHAELKRFFRRDLRSELTALRRDGSVEQIEGEYRLTKRGAGRLRFPKSA